MKYENKRIEKKVDELATGHGMDVEQAHKDMQELVNAGYSEQAALSAWKQANKFIFRRISGTYRVYPLHISNERPATRKNYKTDEVEDTTVQDLYGVVVRVNKQSNTVVSSIDKLPFFGDSAQMLSDLELKSLYKFKGTYDSGKNTYYVDKEGEFIEEEDMKMLKMIGNMATNIHNALGDTIALHELQKKDDKGDYVYASAYDIATIATISEIVDIEKKDGGTFQKTFVDTIENDIPVPMSPPYGEEVPKEIEGEECLIICNTVYNDFDAMITLRAKVIVPLKQLD